jgi:hypothetical protein
MRIVLDGHKSYQPRGLCDDCTDQPTSKGSLCPAETFFLVKLMPAPNLEGWNPGLVKLGLVHVWVYHLATQNRQSKPHFMGPGPVLIHMMLTRRAWKIATEISNLAPKEKP